MTRNRNPVDNHKKRDGSMKRLSIVSIAMVALLGSAVPLSAAESDGTVRTADPRMVVVRKLPASCDSIK